jgi:uncharacterized protein (UPF0276 family)
MPHLGHGVGLRPQHYADVVEPLRRGEQLAGPAWFEVISENFLEPGGPPRRVLHTVREHLPIAMHGVALSLGSVDPLDEAYLQRLQALVHELEPALVSDHLCWGSVDGRYAHDLLPMPFHREALEHVAARVSVVQDRLRRSLVIENVSSYLRFEQSTMTEWEFLRLLVERTGCRLLLDVNNVFVSAHNHGFDALEYVTSLPRGAVAQIHLAGHSEGHGLLLDTHDGPVCDEVWRLYAAALRHHGPVPTCIEWDDALPPFARLVAECDRAARLAREVLRHG